VNNAIVYLARQNPLKITTGLQDILGKKGKNDAVINIFNYKLGSLDSYCLLRYNTM
jgi:hypothetical protein